MSARYGVFWFRQDLRINDNLALNTLINECDKIIPIFILDEKSLIGSASKWWLHYSLDSLNNSFKKRHSELFFFKGSPLKIFEKLTTKYKIDYVYWNRLYDNYSIKRDAKLKIMIS